MDFVEPMMRQPSAARTRAMDLERRIYRVAHIFGRDFDLCPKRSMSTQPGSAAETSRGPSPMIAGAFDLVLLDIKMTGLNGYQVLQHLKNSKTWRDLPVIMISALDEMDSVVRCIELGPEDYLPKPFNPVLLRKRVGDFLEKKWLRDLEVDGCGRIRWA